MAPEHVGNDSDELNLGELLSRAVPGAQRPWEECLPVVCRLAELLRGCLPVLDPPGRLELAVVCAPVLAHHLAADSVEVHGRVGREVDLPTVDAQPLALGPEALFIVFQDWWVEAEDLVLYQSQQDEVWRISSREEHVP